MPYDLAKSRLNYAVRTGRAPHAILLTDSSGAECGLWAYAAKLILCEDGRFIPHTGHENLFEVNRPYNHVNSAQDGDYSGPCGACPACRRFEAGNHADFILVEDEKGIKIDRIRALEGELASKPLSGRRAVVIRRADLMTREAQNALLKSVEEPLGHTFFIVTAQGAMLPTLRSRLMELRCAGDEAPGAMRDGDTLADWAKRGMRMGRGEPVSLEKGEKLDQLLDAWEELYRAALMARFRLETGQIDPALMKIARDCSKNFTIPKLLGIMEAIHQAKRRLKGNANPTLTLDFMAARIGLADANASKGL